jgi:hypothetical protein
MPDEQAGDKNLALDTDWLTAASMAFLFLSCALMSIGVAWTMLTGRWGVSRLSWDTGFLIVCCVWLIFVGDRTLRFAFALLLLGPVLRVFAWLLHVSPQTELTIGIFDRWTDVIVYAGLCLYCVVWFKCKIRYI